MLMVDAAWLGELPNGGDVAATAAAMGAPWGRKMGRGERGEGGEETAGPRSGVLLVQGRAGQGPGAAWRAGAVRPEQLELLRSLQRKVRKVLQLSPWKF